MIRGDGLIKIFKNARTQINGEKESFLRNQQTLLEQFISETIINDRILPKIWKHLRALTCKYQCPWCGVPCCGIKDCNDLYEPGKRVKNGIALNPHSCQFHRDGGITGVVESESPSTLSNRGSCPTLIQDGVSRIRYFEGETKERAQ